VDGHPDLDIGEQYDEWRMSFPDHYFNLHEIAPTLTDRELREFIITLTPLFVAARMGATDNGTSANIHFAMGLLHGERAKRGLPFEIRE
jgi:hypothetical protein